MDFKSELRDAVSLAIDDEVEESRGKNALIPDSPIQVLEERLVNWLDLMGTITLPESRVEVNCIDACAAMIAAKANEFFTNVSVGVFSKSSSFLTRPTG
jgi:hypothetical protein